MEGSLPLSPPSSLRDAGSPTRFGLGGAIHRAVHAALCLALGSSLSCGAERPLLRAKGAAFELVYDGLPRQVLVHLPRRPSLPAGVKSTPPGAGLPLVLVLHGGGGNPAAMIALTRGRFNELADRDGFIVAYPEGYDRSWNDARLGLRSTAHRLKLDDIGFLRYVIRRIARMRPVDPLRVFMTGISNGGFMSLRAACEMSDVLAGVAAVTASMPAEVARPCRPTRPAGVMFVNGTEDPIVPYGGGDVRLFFSKRGRILSTDASVEFWRANNGCRHSPRRMLLADTFPDDGTRAERVSYEGCAPRAPLELLSVRGGGHTWPGGRAYLNRRIIGRTSLDFSAADEIWSFFRSVPRVTVEP